MEPRRIIEDLVREIAPNATVVGVEAHDTRCRVRIAGTTGVVADCEIPLAAVDAAARLGTERLRVASTLKRCADDVVAPLPDGRA